MPLPTLSLTQSQIFTALRTFLLALVPTGTEVIQGEINRVPEPRAQDFIVFWPLREKRLETTETTYADNIITGFIPSTPQLHVQNVIRGSLSPGLLLIDKTSTILSNTILENQISGTPGGIGVYLISQGQELTSETIYAGQRADVAGTELTVQLDIHGPSSADTVRIIETLFRSEYGVNALEATGLAIAPLYTEDPRQMPFINAEQEYEFRWTLDVTLQIGVSIGTPQQFADQVKVTTIEAAPQYTGS